MCSKRLKQFSPCTEALRVLENHIQTAKKCLSPYSFGTVTLPITVCRKPCSLVN